MPGNFDSKTAVKKMRARVFNEDLYGRTTTRNRYRGTNRRWYWFTGVPENYQLPPSTTEPKFPRPITEPS